VFDLWDEASRDVEAEERTRRVSSKKVAVAPVWPFLANATSTDFELMQESRNFHEAAVPPVGSGVENEAEAESELDPEGGLDTLHVAILKYVTAAGEKFIIVDEESGYKVGGPFNDHGEAVSALTSPKFKGKEVKVEKQGEGEEGGEKKSAPGKNPPKTKEHKPRLKGGAPKAKAAAKGFPLDSDEDDEQDSKPPF
jgi:hypothetical protein